MTWTYSGDPSSTSRDAVRFLVGDTDSTDQQVSDEEIAWALAEEGNNELAASVIARAIAASFSRKADKQVGDLRISFKQLSENYFELSKRLEAEGNLAAPTPFAGGVSKSDKETREEDDDRTEPSFRRRQHDHPGALYERGDEDSDICD